MADQTNKTAAPVPNNDAKEDVLAELKTQVQDLSEKVATATKSNEDLKAQVETLSSDLSTQKKMSEELQKQLAAQPTVKEEKKPVKVEKIDTPVKVDGKEVQLLTPFVRLGAHPQMPESIKKYVGKQLSAKDALSNAAVMKHLVTIKSGSIKVLD